jgi:hypothetical protein
MTPGLARDIILLGSPPVAGALLGWALAEMALALVPRLLERPGRVEEAALSLLRRDESRDRLASAVSRLTAGILDSTFGSRQTGAASPPFLSWLLGSRLVLQFVRGAVGRGVSALFRTPASELARQVNLQRLISGGILSPAALSPLLPRGVDGLMAWLRSDAMKDELTTRGRSLLAGTLEKLHAVQRFLISAGQFDKRLDEKMPEVVEDALAAVEALARSPANQERFLRSMTETLGRPGAIEEALIRPGESVGALVFRLFGLTEDAAREGLSNFTLGLLVREETASALAGAAGEGLSRPGGAGVRLGELLGVDGRKKGEMDAFLAERAGGLLEGSLPELVREANPGGIVRGVVRRNRGRVDALGALIGFCAGLVPAGLRFLGV